MNYLIFSFIATFLSMPQAVGAPINNILPQEPENKPPAVENVQIPEILEKIAICESRGLHFDETGKVLTGKNKYDIGKYQINALYWEELAKDLGHDIYTEGGNEAMAMELYKRYGTSPWKWSKKCWDKS